MASEHEQSFGVEMDSMWFGMANETAREKKRTEFCILKHQAGYIVIRDEERRQEETFCSKSKSSAAYGVCNIMSAAKCLPFCACITAIGQEHTLTHTRDLQ